MTRCWCRMSKRCGGFVEQQHGGFLGENPRDHHEGLLAGRQGREREIREGFHPCRRHRSAYRFGVIPARSPAVSGVGVPPEFHHLLHRESEVEPVLLEEHRPGERQLGGFELLDRPSLHEYPAAGGPGVSGQDPDQRRLAGPVGSHQRGQDSRLEVQVDPFEDGAPSHLVAYPRATTGLIPIRLGHAGYGGAATGRRVRRRGR